MRLFIFIVVIFGFLQIPLTEAETEENQSPHFDRKAIVAVKVKGAKDFCSGVVIAPKEILTATHCVYNFSAKEYFPVSSIQVGLGENIFYEGFSWVDVEAVNKSPLNKIDSLQDFLGNDIIRLTTSMSLPVKPLKITKDLKPASPLYAWGFGEDQWGYYGLKKSRQLDGKIIEQDTIAFSSGACRGDSGGPILDDDNQVVGIVSMSLVPHCVEEGKRIAQRVK